MLSDSLKMLNVTILMDWVYKYIDLIFGIVTSLSFVIC